MNQRQLDDERDVRIAEYLRDRREAREREAQRRAVLADPETAETLRQLEAQAHEHRDTMRELLERAGHEYRTLDTVEGVQFDQAEAELGKVRSQITKLLRGF